MPERAAALAEAGAVLARAGRPDAGRKLIDEAAGAAGGIGVTDRPAYVRGRVAGALAPFDLKRALDLVEPLPEPRDRVRYTAFIATAIAASDPTRAIGLADRIAETDTSSTSLTIKIDVAYKLAADRPDEAVRIAEGMKGDGAAKYQAEAFGWLATAIASRDPARARALIDRALAMPLERPDEFGIFSAFGAGTASAAWIATCARRIGYPDMDSVIGRVLATRSAGHGRDPSLDIEATTIAAEALALTDPGAARRVLHDIEARSRQGPTDLDRITRNRWLPAWALVDLNHARDLWDAELAALDAERGVNLQDTGLLRMAEVLALPPERREEYLRGDIGAAWRPGFQH
jgi:hypothetical protein